MDKKSRAVSLKYPENAAAPYISAEGKGLAAQKMLDIAAENHIPVVKDEGLVNVLSLRSVGEIIPKSFMRLSPKSLLLWPQWKRKTLDDA